MQAAPRDPRTGKPTFTPTYHLVDDEPSNIGSSSKKELSDVDSEEEMDNEIAAHFEPDFGFEMSEMGPDFFNTVCKLREEHQQKLAAVEKLYFQKRREAARKEETSDATFSSALSGTTPGSSRKSKVTAWGSRGYSLSSNIPKKYKAMASAFPDRQSIGARLKKPSLRTGNILPSGWVAPTSGSDDATPEKIKQRRGASGSVSSSERNGPGSNEDSASELNTTDGDRSASEDIFRRAARNRNPFAEVKAGPDNDENRRKRSSDDESFHSEGAMSEGRTRKSRNSADSPLDMRRIRFRSGPRPMSAPRLRNSNRVTIPEPFSFSRMDHVRKTSSSQLRVSMLLDEKKKAELGKDRPPPFRAVPVPVSSLEPRLERIERERKIQSMIRKEQLINEMKENSCAFSFCERDKEMVMKRKEREERALLDKAAVVGVQPKAKPAPKIDVQQKKEEEVRKREAAKRAAKERAESLLAQSKLPPRMGQGHSHGSKREDFAMEECTFKPALKDKIPDFDAAYTRFQAAVQSKVQSRRSSANLNPKPFLLRTDLVERTRLEEYLDYYRRKKVAPGVRLERLHALTLTRSASQWDVIVALFKVDGNGESNRCVSGEDLKLFQIDTPDEIEVREKTKRALEQQNELRWPYSEKSIRGDGATPIGPLSTDTNVEPPVMTRSAQLRQIAVQKELRERTKREEALKREDVRDAWMGRLSVLKVSSQESERDVQAARREKQREMKAMVAAKLAEMERGQPKREKEKEEDDPEWWNEKVREIKKKVRQKPLLFEEQYTTCLKQSAINKFNREMKKNKTDAFMSELELNVD